MDQELRHDIELALLSEHGAPPPPTPPRSHVKLARADPLYADGMFGTDGNNKDGDDDASDNSGASSLSAVSRAARRRHRWFWWRCLPAAIAALVLLPCLALALVVVPFYSIVIAPVHALEARMTRTACFVTAHTVIDTKPIDRNTRLLYLPALRVRLHLHDVEPGAMIDALATSRIDKEASWMGGAVRDDFFARHPINATTSCLYDPENVSGRAALRDGVDGMGHMVILCVVASANVFLFSGVLVGFAVQALVHRAYQRAIRTL